MYSSVRNLHKNLLVFCPSRVVFFLQINVLTVQWDSRFGFEHILGLRRLVHVSRQLFVQRFMFPHGCFMAAPHLNGESVPAEVLIL